MPSIPLSLIRFDGGTQPRAEPHGEQAMTGNNAGYVYFVQRITGGAIKIGFTMNVTERVRQLQTAVEVPLRLLGFMRGAPELETSLHDAFSAYRLTGEWFEPAPELVDYATGMGRAWVSGGEYFGIRPAYRSVRGVHSTDAMSRMTFQAVISEKRKKVDALKAELAKLEEARNELSPIWDMHPDYTYGQAERAYLVVMAA